jgi:hypothetical protein
MTARRKLSRADREEDSLHKAQQLPERGPLSHSSSLDQAATQQAAQDPHGARRQAILQLQGKIGNQAVAQLVAQTRAPGGTAGAAVQRLEAGRSGPLQGTIIQRQTMEDVPAAPEGGGETCHVFCYRWLLQAKRITGKVPKAGETMDAQRAIAYLGVRSTDAPARVNGELALEAGDVVSFWLGDKLVHTMIAEQPDSWVGMNNGGCFAGGGTSRQRFDGIGTRVAGSQRPIPKGAEGWVGNGSEWHRPSDNQIVEVRRCHTTRQDVR